MGTHTFRHSRSVLSLVHVCLCEDTDAVDWAEGRHVSPAESLSWRLLLPGEAVVCPLVLNEEVQVSRSVSLLQLL